VSSPSARHRPSGDAGGDAARGEAASRLRDRRTRAAARRASGANRARTVPGLARPALLLALTVASAAATSLAFPPLRWRALAWIAVAPFLVAVRLASLGQALLLGYAWAVSLSLATASWMPKAISTYFEQSALFGTVFFALVVASAMLGPYYAAFAGVYHALGRRLRGWLPFAAAAAWVAAELARGRLFTGTPFFIGNPWALLGYSQVGFPEMVQVASLCGVYGISFALACTNAALAELVLSSRRGVLRPGRAAGTLGLALVPGAGALAFGALELRAADAGTDPGVPIAIVQGHVRLEERWRSDHYARTLESYLELTRETLAQEPAEVVFWPEAAMTFFLGKEPALRRSVESLVRAAGVELVAGGPHETSASPLRVYNSIYLLAPEQGVVARYDKEYLVPFAEYYPFGGVDVMRRSFGRFQVFTPGAPTAPLPTRAGPAGVLVCEEGMLPELARERVHEGAAYLVNPSNDSWSPDRRFTDQYFDLIALRAVEQRRYLVRASTSGPSAIVDPWGHVTAETEPHSRGVARGVIRPRQGRSVYARVGDLFALACVGVTLAALLASGRRPVVGPGPVV
jgi:apolipoprotein N-acyltransferase